MSLPIYVASPVEVRSAVDLFPCATLRCRLQAATCVARQLMSESATGDTERGQAGKYPACSTTTCHDGQWIRGRLTGWLTTSAEGARAHHRAYRVGRGWMRRGVR